MKKLNSKLYLEYFKWSKKYFSNADNLCCEWWYCWSWYAIQQILMSEYMLWFLITMQSQLLVKAIHLRTFWSCTAKNIWQNNTSVIHKHIFLVFFSGLQPQFEKCERKVDTWDNSPLFEDSLFVGTKIDLRNGITSIIEKLFKNRNVSLLRLLKCLSVTWRCYQIHGVFHIHTEKPKGCIWQSTSDCLGDRGTKEQP